MIIPKTNLIIPEISNLEEQIGRIIYVFRTPMYDLF